MDVSVSNHLYIRISLTRLLQQKSFYLHDAQNLQMLSLVTFWVGLSFAVGGSLAHHRMSHSILSTRCFQHIFCINCKKQKCFQTLQFRTVTIKQPDFIPQPGPCVPICCECTECWTSLWHFNVCL